MMNPLALIYRGLPLLLDYDDGLQNQIFSFSKHRDSRYQRPVLKPISDYSASGCILW
jgi:hypothetical protein